MRRDIVLGTSVGIVIGIIAYAVSTRPKPPVAISIEIDPAVYRHANPKYQHPTKTAIDYTASTTKSGYKAPYDVFGFGRDTARNTDSIDPDIYLNMPLESDGIVYNTRDKYTSLELKEEPVEKTYKYIRFTVLAVRGDESTVTIGGIRFLREGQHHTGIILWNPHTGDKTAYGDGEWTDSDQWTAVFVFPESVAIDKYQLKTSNKSPDMDPIEWKVEGSNNASFWNEIHTKVSPLLGDRGSVLSFDIKAN